MERGRVVAVQVDGRRVSGYVVGERLVLTCAHDVPEPGQSVEVFGLAEVRPCAGRVAWRGAPGGLDDVALVEVDDPQWRARRGQSVRWGRLVTTRPGTPCQTWGFPELMTGGGGVDTAHLSGRINIGNAYASNRYTVDLDQFPPDRTWSGMSGAAVFCDGLLAGVVVVEPGHAQHAQLRAVPAVVALHDAGFRAVLERHGARTAALPVELQPLAQADEPAMRSPAALLRAHREVVAFRGREDLLDESVAWCVGGWPFELRLVSGPGGQGKTRLARELGNRLHAKGWETLWLHPSAPAAQLSVLTETTVPLLVVVDYAENRQDLLAELIEIGEHIGQEHPLRLLMLARTGGDWLQQLSARSPVTAEHLTGIEHVSLPPLEPDPADRDTAYRAARTALAQALPAVPALHGRPVPDWTRWNKTLPVPRLEPTVFGGALTLHTTALVDLLDAAYPADASPETVKYRRTVEDRLLVHERAYWTDAAISCGLAPSLGAQALEDALSAAFLVGADTRDEADALLARVPRLTDETNDRRQRVRDWIAGVYPPPEPQRPWDTLQPDRVAERLVGNRLAQDPTLADHLITDATPRQLDRTLTVYARAAAQPAFGGALDQPMAALIVTHHQALATRAIDVATRVERPYPLVFALGHITQDPDAPAGYLTNLAGRLPHSSQALADWAAQVTARLVELYRAAESSSGAQPRVLAPWLNNLSVRLGDLGRYEDALAAGEEAVRAYRALADARPDAFLPDLAGSLNNLSIRLGDLGRYEDGLAASEEAIQIRTQLAARWPTRYQVELDRSLQVRSLLTS